MNKIMVSLHRSLPVLLLLAVLPVTALASGDENPADTIAAGEHRSIAAGEHRSIATMLAGRFVSMAGEVPDFMGAGQTVTITGEVSDNALAFGQVVTLSRGTVAGDLLAMGRTVQIDGVVAGDLYAGCRELRIGPEGVVLGNLYLGADLLTIEGRVAGTLHGGVGRIRLDGELGGGDICLGEQGDFELGPAALISGDLRYCAVRQIDVPAGAEILGNLDFVELEPGEAEGEDGFSILFFLWCLVAAMIVGLVLLAVAGPWMRASAASLRTSAGPALGWGALWLIATPVAAVLVMISVVGLPLGILAAGAYAAALYIAPLPLSLWLGDWLLRKMRRPAPGAFLSLSLGLLIYKILAAVPWLGIIVIAGTLVLGLGAMFLGCRQLQKKLAG